MYSSPSPDLEAFQRLGLYDMPPVTRQQEREGRSRYEVSYSVVIAGDHGGSSDVTHYYDLDFKPPNSFWDAIEEQGKNISHVVQVEHVPGGYHEGPHYRIELQEKVTVSVYDGGNRNDNTRLALLCDCSHRTDRRACKHVSFVLDQLLQCHKEARRTSRPRSSCRMTMDEEGTTVGYWNDRGSWVALSPFRVIEKIGEDEVANAISRRRRVNDAVQCLDHRRERIKRFFHALDEYVLRGPFLIPFYQYHDMEQSISMVGDEYCAAQLQGLEEDIYKVWDDLNRGAYRDESHSIASQWLIPTLLFLLKGVVIRHQGEVRDSMKTILHSGDLYGLLIREVDRQDPFVLRILRQLPPPYATREQRQEKREIALMMHDLNLTVGSQSTPAIRFQEQLENLWSTE